MKKFENVYYFFSNTELDPHNFFYEVFVEEQNPRRDMISNKPRLFTINDINTENTIGNFTYRYKDIDYECSYHYKKLDPDKKVFKVSICLNYTSKKEQAANALSDLIRHINRNKKNEFNMTVINDSLSTYYSQRLYSKLALYERSMRALITAIFIPIYKRFVGRKVTGYIG